MIEVTLWGGTQDGSGCITYLIDIPTDHKALPPGGYFKAAPTATAIRRALTEVETQHPNWRISKIDVRDTPDKVLQP